MASGFWVVEMTERANLISAFITPFGLFESLRMPFEFKNAPQIYQRLIDNALDEYLKIGCNAPSESNLDVVKGGERRQIGGHLYWGGDRTPKISLYRQQRGMGYINKWKD